MSAHVCVLRSNGLVAGQAEGASIRHELARAFFHACHPDSRDRPTAAQAVGMLLDERSEFVLAGTPVDSNLLDIRIICQGV